MRGECLHSMRWVLHWSVGSSWWHHWLVLNWHLFYRVAAVQILQTNKVEVIAYYPSQTHWTQVSLGFRRGTWIDWIPWFALLVARRLLTAQEAWTYQMARRCISGSAVLLGCWYKVLKIVVQDPLAVRCRMRWVAHDNCWLFGGECCPYC